ncbi:MAG: hypothetical protein DCC55_28500 [Chloroflexi bacterium]|nr:MAG: hypothetical protein DCC55_28500 [Chloroflexota bacterium]
MTRHKDKVSYIVLALIAVLTLASILNIIQKSRHYHYGFSANLIGIGFGVSLAVTVYIVMIADTAKTRWTAAIFAIVFAAVSATIQTALYLDEQAPFGVALAYGAGVPGFEAALAILEALLRREVATEARDAEIERLASDVADRDVALESAAATIGELTAKLTDMERRLAEAPAPAPSSANGDRQTTRQPSATLTAKQIAKMQEVAQVAEDGGFATDGELADLLSWSETTARRYRSLAERHGFIAVNGDNRYHRKNTS